MIYNFTQKKIVAVDIAAILFNTLIKTILILIKY